jgi:hypothetical protein
VLRGIVIRLNNLTVIIVTKIKRNNSNRQFVMKALSIILITLTYFNSQASMAASDIAQCGSISGWTHYHAGDVMLAARSGWQKDGISKGKTALKKLDSGDFDILYLDATGSIYSYIQDGYKIWRVRASGSDIALVLVSPRGIIEFYNFYKEPNGKLKMDWAQNKGDTFLIAKSSMMSGECSFIEFDAAK